LISDFELNPKIKCRGYSKGNRQKVAVIAALATIGMRRRVLTA
jgi:ABC-2 type transport system ATP-binding protein